jgi:hypothetical protein
MANRRIIISFFSLFGLYFIARFLRQNWAEAPLFLRFYFTDLLFVPTMCWSALFVVRWVKRNNSITISPVLIFIQVILVSIYFEWYLPNYKSHLHPYTSDYWDVLMYGLGGLIFWWWQKTANSPKKNHRRLER